MHLSFLEAGQVRSVCCLISWHYLVLRFINMMALAVVTFLHTYIFDQLLFVCICPYSLVEVRKYEIRNTVAILVSLIFLTLVLLVRKAKRKK